MTRFTTTYLLPATLAALVVACTSGEAPDDFTKPTATGEPALGASGGTTAGGGAPSAGGGVPTPTGGGPAMGGAPATGGGITTGGNGGAASACPPAGTYLVTDVEDPSLDRLWFEFDDGSSTGTRQPLIGTDGGNRAAHAAGTGFTDWGAGIGFDVSGRSDCFDLSTYGGVRFKARGSGTVKVAVTTLDTLPAEVGGECTGDCYDFHSRTITLSNEWKPFSFAYSQLLQEGWGTQVGAPKPGRVVSLQLSSDSMPYDFWLDDVELIPADDVDVGSGDPCADPGLQWSTARKTEYESYPDPGSAECIQYNGCYWEGLFAACWDGKKSEAWVQERNIAAVFPNYGDMTLHRLCIRSGNQSMVVTVYDTCADSDCSGCCTAAKGSQPLLIDLEKYTAQRFGVPDGEIEWADLGPAPGDPCSD